MKIPHKGSTLTNHLADMRNFMPAAHRRYLDEVSVLPDPKPLASAEPFNAVLEAIAGFREIHFGWADLYIHQRVSDPRGTGGTPYRQWLQATDPTRPEVIGSRQRTEDRGQKTEDRGQRTEDRRQKTEDRRQRTEDRAQRTEHRAQSTEDRRQKTEGRAQRTEQVILLLDEISSFAIIRT